MSTKIKAQLVDKVLTLVSFIVFSGKCKANFAYPGIPAPDDDRPVITFEVNDVIELLNDSDAHWWEVGNPLAN